MRNGGNAEKTVQGASAMNQKPSTYIRTFQQNLFVTDVIYRMIEKTCWRKYSPLP
jgi:hypothetical protein